jgi:tartrate/fumarate subfamily iron-sulfur-dependent hydro-lyase beta chain
MALLKIKYKEFKMISITYPFQEDDIRKLKVGDMVLLNGTLLTGRDAVHKRLHDGVEPPIPLKDHIIYHCGPVVLEKNGEYEVKAAGPTTSIREEPYEWQVMRDHGIRGVIGKGGMGKKTLEACQKYGACYFHAIGGAAQVLAEKILRVDDVFWKDLGSPEAIWKLTVKDFPVFCTMDANGNSLHQEVADKSAAKLKELL